MNDPGDAREEGYRSLDSAETLREAMVEVARSADRELAILAQELEGAVFDDRDFVDAVKHFCLTRRYGTVRVLVGSGQRSFRDGNRFVYLGRRLTSFFEFRLVSREYADHRQSFMVADHSAVVYRPYGDRWEGTVDLADPAGARRCLALFDEMWHHAEPAVEFRRLDL